jgi:putative ABC transport system permease protein
MSASRAPRLARLAERGYRAVLRLFPSSFLVLYGEDAVDTFRDLVADAARRGTAAFIRTVLVTYGRALAVALRERFGGRDDKRRLRARGLVGTDQLERLHMIWQDIRFALRGFRRSPGFAVTVVALIALGIGATTVVWSVVDGVMLRQLPYSDAERLVYFDNGAHTVPKLRDWREQADSFDRLVAVTTDSVAVAGGGEPVQIQAAAVTPGFLELFEAVPLLGRSLVESDFEEPAKVVLLAHGFWVARFAGDPAAVGKTVDIDGEPFEIVGVLHPDFRPPEALVGGGPRMTSSRIPGGGAAVWQPLDEQDPLLQDRHVHVLSVAARLAPGVELEQAQSQLDTIAERLAAAHPDTEMRDDGPRLTPLVPLRDATVGHVARTLWIFLGAVAMMLLIACFNVASLFLARGTTREREVSVRSALGAGRGRIAAQMLTESLLLSLCGAALGTVTAALGVRALRNVLAEAVPRVGEVAVDWRVLLFVLALALATGVTFGTAPALQASRADSGAALKTASSGGSRRQNRLRSGLVVAEVALALVLLTGAGLLFRSFLALRSVDIGFDADRMVVLGLEVGGHGEKDAPRRARFAPELVTRLEAIPGVTRAAATWVLPFDFTGGARCCWRAPIHRSDRPDDEPLAMSIHPVTGGYFRVLGVPVVAGRELTDRETEVPTAVVLSRTAARELFGDEEAVGELVRNQREEFRVVGVVEDFKQWGVATDQGAQMYVPFSAHGGMAPMLSVAIRATLPLEQVAEPIREAVWSLDPRQPVRAIASMDDRIAGSIATPRFRTLLFGAFAGVAMVLAAAGVYGSLLYTVSQRLREMGIRLALGAGRADVVRLVVRQGLMQVLAGIVLGIAGSMLLARALESLLFEVGATDPLTLASVAAGLAAITLLACWPPARRAATTNPLESLRAE